MIKSQPTLRVSPRPFIQDIKNSIIRGHKYYRAVKLIDEDEDINKRMAHQFLRKMKKVKSMSTFKLQVGVYSKMSTKLEMVKSVLKVHSQVLQEVDVSNFPSKREKNILRSIKKLNTVHVPSDWSNINNLKFLRKAEKLLINFINKEAQIDLLQRTMRRLRSLDHVCLLVFPSFLEKILSVLSSFSDITGCQAKFQILTKEEEFDYEEPSFSFPVVQRLTKLKLEPLTSCLALQNLLGIQSVNLLNLKNLKLGFSVPKLEAISYLKNLEHLPCLEKLSLFFTECWDTKFAEQLIKDIRLPVMLQQFKINMPLSFKNIIKKYAQNTKGPYPWRNNNFFEVELLFSSFFQSLEQARHLKKVKFIIQILEAFDSHYTNFFVSVVNRLPNLSSITMHVSDYTLQKDLSHAISQPFDLALFFQACSKIKNLEHLEVIMPNLMIEGTEISSKMTRLRDLIIGISDNNEEENKEALKLCNISKSVIGWLKKLASIVPNLTSLALDFTEVIDEPAFLRRFTSIKRFRQLQEFGSRFVIKKCSVTTANVGKAAYHRT